MLNKVNNNNKFVILCKICSVFALVPILSVSVFAGKNRVSESNLSTPDKKDLLESFLNSDLNVVLTSNYLSKALINYTHEQAEALKKELPGIRSKRLIEKPVGVHCKFIKLRNQIFGAKEELTGGQYKLDTEEECLVLKNELLLAFDSYYNQIKCYCSSISYQSTAESCVVITDYIEHKYNMFAIKLREFPHEQETTHSKFINFSEKYKIMVKDMADKVQKEDLIKMKNASDFYYEVFSDSNSILS